MPSVTALPRHLRVFYVDLDQWRVQFEFAPAKDGHLAVRQIKIAPIDDAAVPPGRGITGALLRRVRPDWAIRQCRFELAKSAPRRTDLSKSRRGRPIKNHEFYREIAERYTALCGAGLYARIPSTIATQMGVSGARIRKSIPRAMQLGYFHQERKVEPNAMPFSKRQMAAFLKRNRKADSARRSAQR